MRRTVRVSAALLSVLALCACSGKTGGGNATSTAADAGTTPATSPAAASAPLYPDWAQSVAPPYPNAPIGILVNTGMYQFQSPDDLATVAAWYKSHVTATWKTDAASGDTHATVNGVQIDISKNTLTAGDAWKVKTMIILSKG